MPWSLVQQSLAIGLGKGKLKFSGQQHPQKMIKKSDFPIPILTSCLQSVIASKWIDRFWCAWFQLLAFFKLYVIHVKKSNIARKKPSYGVLGVSRLQMPDFPPPILVTCLISVIAPKWNDRVCCGWWHSLAFLKLYMIRIKKSKIGQEKAELWGKREMRFLCAASRSLHSHCPILTSCLRSVIAPKRIDRF